MLDRTAVDFSAPEDAVASLGSIRWSFAFDAWVQSRQFAEIRRLRADQFRQPGVVPAGPGNGSIEDALAHLVNVQARWLARWHGVELSELGQSTSYTCRCSLGRALEEIQAERRRFVEHLRPRGLGRPVRFVPSDHDSTECFPLWQTLLHSSEHAGQDRARIAAGLVRLGITLPGADLQDFVAEQTAAASSKQHAPSSERSRLPRFRRASALLGRLRGSHKH